MHISQQTVSIKDLGVVTTLVVLGHKFIRVEKDHQGICLFTFDSSSRIGGLVEAYWDGKLRVDPKLFFETQKSLKNRIYNS